MITTAGIREREGVRWTNQLIPLNDIEIQCEVKIVSTWNGDGFDRVLTAYPVWFTVMGSRFEFARQLADMRASIKLIANEHIKDWESDILDRVF